MVMLLGQPCLVRYIYKSMYGTSCHNTGIGFFIMVNNFLTCGRVKLRGTLCEACQALRVLCSLLEWGVPLMLHADLVEVQQRL